MAFLDEKLLSIARSAAFQAGERLMRQGEPSRGAFFIREGDVQAQVALPGGERLVVATLGPGGLLGETALLERGRCSADVVALGRVNAWFIDRGDFRALAASRDAAALEAQRLVTRALVRKVRATHERLAPYLAREGAPARNPDASPPFRASPTFDWRRFLPVLPFFTDFEPHEIDSLIRGCEAYEVPRGAELFEAGDAPGPCLLVLRGALDVNVRLQGGGGERRTTAQVGIAGPGELAGHLALVDGGTQPTGARVREPACLLELTTKQFRAWYEGDSPVAVRLQHAIHRGLLKTMARTNTQLSRLIFEARLRGERGAGDALEAARSSQLVAADPSRDSGV